MDTSLRPFLAIAQAQNLTRAARNIGISQPALTKKLRQLETRFDAQLFVRRPRGMCLTAYGQVLYKYALEIEEKNRQATEEMSALKSGYLARFRIGAGLAFMHAYMPEVLHDLRLEFPRTQLVLSAVTGEFATAKLRDNAVDAVIGRIPAGQPDEGISVTPLATFSHCLILGRAAAAGLKPRPQPRDLIDYNWIAYGEGARPDDTLERFFRDAGLEPPEPAIFSNSFSTAVKLVAAGNFAMIIPRQLRRMIGAADAVVCPITAPLQKYRVGIVHRTASLRYPIVGRFTAIFQQVFGEKDGGGHGPE
jgi:LysR family transcriptional regulator, regulator of abg operon